MTQLNQKQAYVLKINLVGIKPTIWRRFCVPGEITLDRLHDVIQIVMGWSETHLHRFEISGRRFTEQPEDVDQDGQDEAAVVLHDVVPRAGARFLYGYDFGDNWRHEILVEAIDEVPEAHRACIRCLEGKRACPPEDVGGTGGFDEFLEAIKDRKHPEHQSHMDWCGGFDPNAFDCDAVNFELARCARWSRPRSVETQLFAG